MRNAPDGNGGSELSRDPAVVGTKLELTRPMGRVAVLMARCNDADALKDLLRQEGRVVEIVQDVDRLGELTPRPDVIVADLEAWTRGGKALVHRTSPALAAARVVMMLARVPNSAPPTGVRFLSKPVGLEELRAAISEGEQGCDSPVA
jgi:DNA-binding response OmpR family regulator